MYRQPNPAVPRYPMGGPMEDAMLCICEAAPTRVIVLDFGAPASLLDDFMGALSTPYVCNRTRIRYHCDTSMPGA